MKKIIIFLLGISCLAACTNSGSSKTTTMNIHDESGTIRIKSSGKVRFNSDNTAISSISDFGYLEYSHNNKKMKAEADGDGIISYSLQNGHKKLKLDDEGRRFIASIINDIVRRGFNN